MSLSYEEVGDILRLIERLDCDEVLVEMGELRIQVRRGRNSAGHRDQPPAAATVAPSPAARPGPDAACDEPPAGEPATPPPEAGWVPVRAPMVGVFYRAPAPGRPPFVEVGSRVEAGQTLAIIEVMKLMNHVPAEAPGLVVRIDARDGTMVEYGGALMWIEPDP